MKWKMAENSLFAVLLRSPWWISFALAIVVGLVGRLVFPQQFATVATLSGLPFAVIGVMALRRQWGAPSSEKVAALVQELQTLSWPAFASRLEAGWTRHGFQVEHLHGPADFRLKKDGASTLVMAKRWKAGNHGVEALKTLAQERTAQDARFGVYIALAPLSQPCTVFAKKNGIDLPDADALARWLT
jgi:restriction system protein